MRRYGSYLVTRPAVLFVLLSTATVLFALLELTASYADTRTSIVAAGSGLVSCAAVLLMHRAPWLAMTTALLTLGLTIVFPVSSPMAYLLLAVGCASVANWGRHASLTVLLTAVVCVAGAVLSAGAGTSGAVYTLTEVLYSTVLPVLVAALAMAIGLAARAQRQVLAQLRSSHDELEVLQKRDTEAAITIERTRIARELHDIVAHHVSALLIQAQAGQRIAERSGTEEAARWRSIADVARETLQSMRRVVGLLRTDDGLPTTGNFRDPQPRLADLTHLVDTVRAAGLDVSLQMAGPVDLLPTDIQHCAYRIIQEALTNVLRHASAGHAVVRIACEADSLAVDVSDDGRVRTGFRLGNGLLGMRERIATVGGRLEIRSEPDHGLQIHARFPLESEWSTPPVSFS